MRHNTGPGLLLGSSLSTCLMGVMGAPAAAGRTVHVVPRNDKCHLRLVLTLGGVE